MIKNIVTRIMFILFLLASIITSIVFIGISISQNKIDIISFLILCVTVIATVISYLLIKKSLDEYERNNRNYVKHCFSDFIEKGYKLTDFSVNAESSYCFSKDNICFSLEIEFDNVDFTVRIGSSYPYVKEINIRSLIQTEIFSFLDSSSSTKSKIDEVSKIVRLHYDEIIEKMSDSGVDSY